MQIHTKTLLALWLALSAWIMPAGAAEPAGPDLMLYPTRVVLDRAVRSAQVDLVNTSTEPATYRLRMVDRRMDADGQLLPEIEGADGSSAAQMLRFSPRQVVLAPGAAQTVRIMLRKPPDLPAGEYRSHLLFERVASQRPPERATGLEPDLQIQLVALVSVSIPVIVRQGDTQAHVAIAGPALHRQASGDGVLSFALQREGNRSVFGDLVATWVAATGTEARIGEARGVAVYTPNPERRVRLAVTMPPARGPGFVKIEFKDRAADGGTGDAQARMTVQ
ncbi:MAG TPA: hypothetical protein VM074_05260 [Solimonas sp.]|nr:hypothetical protein [Solimonas sp.]